MFYYPMPRFYIDYGYLCNRFRTFNTDINKEHVIIRTFWNAPDYLRTLPLHPSQKELSNDNESTLFSFDVRPTFDFYQMLLAQEDQIDVIEPASVRNEMKRFAENILSYYKK